MDAFSDSRIRKITLCFGSQSGKTEALLNMQGYAVCQDPDPMMMVYPDENTAKRHATRRLKKNIQSTPEWAERYIGKQSTGLEYQFVGMFLLFAWSGSPSTLASTPCRYVMQDEVDKFQAKSGAEDDPVSLANQRTKTYPNRKIVLASTPTIETGPIWRSLTTSDLVKGYFVPCPHCGEMQTFYMRQIKWPKGASPAEAKQSAWYECIACQGEIRDIHKRKMLLNGEWRPIRWNLDETKFETCEGGASVESVAFQLNSIYSPSMSFGEMAEEWLKAEKDPLSLMPFVNGYLAEPWVKKGSKVRSQAVMNLAAESTYERGTVPKGVEFLTLGADYQQDHIRWVVRGWGANVTSWCIDYGRCEDWYEFEALLNKSFYDKDNNEFMVARACIDSGYKKDDVYEFCSYYADRCRPTKGASGSLSTLYNISSIDKEMGKYGMLKLFLVNTPQAKDFVYSRIQRQPNARGSWNVPKNIEQEYADQVCSEHKVQEQKNGRIIEVYKVLYGHLANHYLDCECLNYVAAEWAGVRYLTEETAPQAPISQTLPEIKPNPWALGSNPW